MASLGLLLLCTALIHTAQSIPAVRGGGRGLDGTMGGAQRQRIDVRNLLPYEAMMSQGGGGANNLYYGSDDWRGQGLDQALQRLVERDQRREHEEAQRAAYLAALLRLLTEAESAGLVGPGDLELVEEEEEEEEDQEPQEDFQGPAPQDYDETGRGLNMGRPAAWWGHLEPQLAQALLNRAEPRLAQTLLQQVQGRVSPGGSRGDEEVLRRLVARLLSRIGPTPSRRMRRDLSVTPAGPARRRTRRSLDNMAPPLPSNAPPLLRVKRLGEEEEEEKLHPPFAELQRMKRINTMATATIEELNHGSRRRRRREVLNYDPQVLINHMVEYMRE